VLHSPSAGCTRQLHNPALLAELTRIAVVADFRRRDLAAGGQGAPLVPAFHDEVFRNPDKKLAVVNIGGISNITWLAPQEAVLGWDCGPGNILLDAWINKQLGQNYDRDGAWSLSGQVIPELLEDWLKDDYFSLPPPKSCGRGEFGQSWFDHVAPSFSGEDVQATLTALTISCISRDIKTYFGEPDEIYLCGGGAYNQAIKQGLQKTLQPGLVQDTSVLGMPAEQVEATAFAWLALRHIQSLPGNLPRITGAKGYRILGAYYPS